MDEIKSRLSQIAKSKGRSGWERRSGPRDGMNAEDLIPGHENHSRFQAVFMSNGETMFTGATAGLEDEKEQWTPIVAVQATSEVSAAELRDLSGVSALAEQHFKAVEKRTEHVESVVIELDCEDDEEVDGLFLSTSTEDESMSSPVSPVFSDPHLKGPPSLDRQPAKGILRVPKRITTVEQDYPQPVQRAAFLKQEEIRRLSRFTERMRHRRADQSIEDCLVSPSQKSPVTKSGFFGPSAGKALATQEEEEGERKRVELAMEKNLEHRTWAHDEYERGGVQYIAKRLTPETAMVIKRELNEMKREMLVHEDSRRFTQFYIIRPS